MKSPVQLYLRVRLSDGSYPYLKPAYARNGRIRPHHAVHKGRAAHYPGSTYYVRYQLCGKRVWEAAGDDPSVALVNLQKKVQSFQTDASAPAAATSKRPLADCVTKYLAETAEHKSVRTLAVYRLTVFDFARS